MRYLILLLVCTSCLTVGQIERNCDKFEAVCFEPQPPDTTWINTVDTVFQVVTKYIDRTIKIKGDTVKEYVPVYIDSGKVIADTARASTEWSEAMAFIQDNELRLILTNKDTTLVFKDSIQSLNLIVTELKKEIIKRDNVIKENSKLPFWSIFAFICIVLLAFYFKLKR